MLSLEFSRQELDLRPIPIKSSDKLKLKPSTMKKFLAIIALATFVACNNSGDTSDAAADSARVADSIRREDSMKAAQQQMTPDTTKTDTTKMQKK